MARPHSVASKKNINTSFFAAIYYRKGVFFMKKIRELLGIRHFSVSEMCHLGLLCAITVILAVYATFRVGNLIKIPLKFISVFITGAIFGPLPAALVGLLGDILNTVLMPSGAWLPGISMVEFVSGFIYGAFFYKRFNFSKSYLLRLVLCVLCQGMLDMFVTPVFLVQAGFFVSYPAALALRFPATVIKAFAQGAVILLSASYLPIFAKQVRIR